MNKMAYGFFLGPSCKAPGRFCPMMAFASEYPSSSSDILGIRVEIMKAKIERRAFYIKGQGVN